MYCNGVTRAKTNHQGTHSNAYKFNFSLLYTLVLSALSWNSFTVTLQASLSFRNVHATPTLMLRLVSNVQLVKGLLLRNALL